MNTPIQIYATTPESVPQQSFEGAVTPSGKDYVRLVQDSACWAEQYGCAGTLIYTNNTLVDGWQVARTVLETTSHLRPLVAVEPTLMSPYAVSKILTTFAHLFERTVDINLVAGGFNGHLKARDDNFSHDRRYERVEEYGRFIQLLLSSQRPASMDGEFYHMKNLKLVPPMTPEFQPLVTLAGSSEAGRQAARALGATQIHYPVPIEDFASIHLSEEGNSGVRIGIITRPTSEEAWAEADRRFPTSKQGHRMHVMASRTSDASWHKRLRELELDAEGERGVYWLKPFKTYKTFCPYYVGSYEDVAAELAGMIELGVSLFVLDILETEEDYFHTQQVFGLAHPKKMSEAMG
jgi:alkanesulfonate monooxygenase